ncbi:MAG: M23 family metallopeptidase [Pseudomonadota bacterium]
MTWYATSLFQHFADVDGKSRVVVPPVAKDGHVLIEARAFEAMGMAKVAWNALASRVFIMPPCLAWPTGCRTFSSPFGWRVLDGKKQFHSGTDFPVAEGTEVVAALPGTVHIAGEDPEGFGQYLVIAHEGGLFTLYAHLSEILTAAGKVEEGQPVARSGNTGRSTGPHLHFALYATSARYPLLQGSVFNKEAAVDPWPFFKR